MRLLEPIVNATINHLKQSKLTDKRCESVLWQTERFCKLYLRFVIWLADISTNFCYKKLIEIGAKPTGLYYVAFGWAENYNKTIDCHCLILASVDN